MRKATVEINYIY